MAARDEAIAMAMRRKEEYLGARVPRELRDRVIQRAKSMDIPVSILIRKVLEDAFLRDEVDIGAGKPGAGESGALEGRRYEAVLGWDRIKLNKPMPCAGCGVELPPGSSVTMGVGATSPVILCDVCEGDV